MAFSYSFHISSKSHSVSTVGKASQVSRHNLREYKSHNYDKNQIEVLVGSSDNLLNDIKRVYHQEFDEALEQYNQKQKRDDRKIDDYLAHVSNSRSDVAVEVIIQLGDKDFWKDKDMSQQRNMTHILKDQLKALGEYCPDFKVASAVIHYDESSPHMHVVGVPVARGYKKGMTVQCAKTKVFTKESLTFLQDKMREHAEECMKNYPGIFEERKLKEKEKGRNKDIPKKSLDNYYWYKNKIDDVKEEYKTVRSDLISAKNEYDVAGFNFKILSEKNIELKEECEKLKKAQTKASNTLIDTQNELNEVRTQLNLTKNNFERIKAEYDTIKRNSATALSEYNSIKQDIAEMTAHYEKLKNKPPLEKIVYKEVNVDYKGLFNKLADILWRIYDKLFQNRLLRYDFDKPENKIKNDISYQELTIAAIESDDLIKGVEECIRTHNKAKYSQPNKLI